MKKRRKPIVRTEKEKRQMMEEWKSSGKSILAFCREKDISVSLFYYWRRKFLPATIVANKRTKTRRTQENMGKPEITVIEKSPPKRATPNVVRVAVFTCQSQNLQEVLKCIGL